MEFSTFEELKAASKEEPCKGKIFRCKINMFLNQKKEFVRSVRMVLLKKDSCSGCPDCGYLIDEMQEFISNETEPFIDKEVQGGKYRLMVTNVTTDHESGIVDGWDLMFKFIGMGDNVKKG